MFEVIFSPDHNSTTFGTITITRDDFILVLRGDIVADKAGIAAKAKELYAIHLTKNTSKSSNVQALKTECNK